MVAAAALYAVLFVTGAALGFPQVPLPYHPPRRVSAWLGAVIHMWAYGSMAAYLLFTGARALSRPAGAAL